MTDKEKPYESISWMFCGHDDFRAWMQSPMTIGKHTYATDAHIVVRCDASKTDKHPQPEERHVKAILCFFPDKTPLDFKISTSELKDVLDAIESVDIYDNSTVDGKCAECRGSGEVEWEYEGWTKDDECPACDGEGTVEVDDRKKTGLKRLNSASKIDILSSRFDPNYIQLIHRVASLLDCENIVLKSQAGPIASSVFEINDIDILLMPTKKSEGDVVAYHFAKSYKGE